MFTIRFDTPSRRLLAAAVLGLASLLTAVDSAGATSLVPGSGPTPLVAAPVVAPGGTVLADTGYLGYSQIDLATGALFGTGFIREIVLAGDPANVGFLDFIYQIKVTTGDVTRMTVTNYAGWTTDVTSAPVAANTLPALLVVPTAFDPSASGAVANGDRISATTVGFNFIDAPGDLVPLLPGNVSDLMIIRTNATSYQIGGINIIDGATAQKIGFAPNPEPASLTLLGIGLAGMAGYGARRRPKLQPLG